MSMDYNFSTLSDEESPGVEPPSLPSPPEQEAPAFPSPHEDEASASAPPPEEASDSSSSSEDILDLLPSYLRPARTRAEAPLQEAVPNEYLGPAMTSSSALRPDMDFWTLQMQTMMQV